MEAEVFAIALDALNESSAALPFGLSRLLRRSAIRLKSRCSTPRWRACRASSRERSRAEVTLRSAQF